MSIVDGFKVIEVENHGAEREPIPSRLVEKSAKMGFEERRLGNPGKGSTAAISSDVSTFSRR